MNIFYCPEILNGQTILDKEESGHAVRVLRMKEGDNLTIVDGKGGFYTAKITTANANQCSFEIIEKKENYGKRNFYLHIAIAPTKNFDRTEWFLEKVTEIGIDEITFLNCEKSERRVVKSERAEKIVVSAMKQSVKAFLPKLNACLPDRQEIVDFKKFIKSQSAEAKFIAHCRDGEKQNLKDCIKTNKNILILIGAEGDFSEAEVKLATENGYVSVSLGESRLRTETAGVVACHTVNLLNG